MNNCNLTPCFKNSCKSTTACETCADNVVCGHAVERASRGKSGCECKCRFPNTGGLHRTSGDAPLDTHRSSHPPWSHVHESNSPSSRRTKFAAVASRHGKREFTSHSTDDKKDETACRMCVDNVVCGHAVEQASWGKSGCECKCRFPNTGGLHRTSGDAPLDTHRSSHPPWSHVHESNSPSSRRTKFAAVASRHGKREFTSHSTDDKKDETACRMCVDNVVCGHAVEQASWGKSGCECKCRFQNTRGLHRTSRDALLETHHSPHPPWCHVHKSNSPSSRRTQVAAVSFIHKKEESTKHSIIHRRLVNANNKSLKQFYLLKDVKVCSVVSKKINYLTMDYIKKNIVVCDGGDNECDGIQNTSDFENVCYLRIRDGDLWVADTVNYCKGLRYILPGKSSPVFIRLPRNKMHLPS